MKKPLVFLDIDGTLIDKNYQFNFDDPSTIFKKFVDMGWLFAFNSNRALEDMLPLYKKTNMNGFIIVENSSYIYEPKMQKTTFLISEKQKEKMTELKSKLPVLIEQLILSRYGKKIEWFNVDTVKTKNLKILSDHIHPEKIHIHNNSFRKYSASMHIKIAKNGTLIQAPEEMMFEINNGLKKLLKDEEIPIIINHSTLFGNILINFKSPNKLDGVEYIFKDKKNNYDFFAIGDELNDCQMVDNIGKFLTVKNAKNEVKNKSVFSSKYPYTKGVIECMKWIEGDNNEK